MASRRLSALRREALTSHLREALRSGRLPPGARLPALRTLATTFGLSAPTVLDELQTLIAEGALVSVPGTGIFVADDAPEVRPVFLFVHDQPLGPGHLHHLAAIRLGFEEAVSELGGATITLPCDELSQLSGDEHPAVAGVASWLSSDPAGTALARLPVPQVRIGQYRTGEAGDGFDTVALDDRAGGRLGTTHLLRRGYHRIAFLALHPVDGDPSGRYRYSEDRLAGWRETMAGARRSPDGLAFHPPVPVVHYRTAIRAAADAARQLLEHRDAFDAVLAADDHAVLGLAEAWREAGVPDHEWPAIVGFEDVEAARGYATSSIIPQWSELGEHAATLLWSRHRGTLTTPPTHRMASMKFVARITAEQDWLSGTRSRLTERPS